MTRQAQYCNAQSFELSVKTSPIKCREISTIKSISGFAQVPLHRIIRCGHRQRQPALPTDPGRVGSSSRHADGGRCRRLRSQSRPTRIAPRRRPLV